MIRNILASVPVTDLDRSRQWYETLFGRPADSSGMEGLLEWKAAGGGWLQVYVGPARSGGGSCTLAVEDIDSEIERLRKAGFKVDPAGSGKVRVTMIKDPDGNSIALAESSDPDLAQ